jgi:hypothetical protein
MEKILQKKGFYTIYEIVSRGKTKYKVDSGKLLYVARYKKYIPNPYRDIKEFSSIDKATQYVQKKLKTSKKRKDKKLSNLPKSLYFILIKEQKTGITFIKIGITTKKFIMRRFSNAHGYEGYTVETILRRIDTPDAEKIEKKIHQELKKKNSVKNYRPELKNFGGYSECYDGSCFNQVAEVFDKHTRNL